MPKRSILATLIAASLGCLACPGAQAQSDTSGSQRVGHLQFGNSLDPGGWQPFEAPDPRGMSWLHPGRLRTPTGVLYPWPHEGPEDEAPAVGGWAWSGLVQFGWLATTGDTDHALFREYAGWDHGPALALAAFSGFNRDTGGWLEFRGSRIGADDQYYRLRGGRAGAQHYEFFHRDTLHTLSTTAHPLWNGVGGMDLRLPDGLVIGGPRAAVADAVAASPARSLAVARRTTGASWEGAATRHWIGYAGVTHERREGERLWGGPMYFTYFYGTPGGPGAPVAPGRRGGQYETVRPVDFDTTNVDLGLRNRGGAMGWLFDFGMHGSFFRDRKDQLRFQAPFAVTPGATSAITGGTWALEPDNDYYNLRVEASHPLALWKGDFSFTASWASMRQDDPLQAPMDPEFCPDGAFIGNSGIACSDWNTTDALSRTSARARIDTRLLDMRVDFRPTDALALFARLRRHDEDNRTRYMMFNPLTGQYGYVAENGVVALMIANPAFSDLFDPDDPARAGVFAQVANLPFSEDRLTFELGGERTLRERDSIGLRYRFERRSPHLRERTRIDAHRFALDWDARVLEDASLRVSAEWERRDGDTYAPNPYLEAWSPSMPGYVSPPNGYTAFTVAQMAKYDMGDRDTLEFKAILVKPVGLDATFSGSLQGRRLDYDTRIGRRALDTWGADLSWDWSPSPGTTVSAYASYQSSRLRQGNVADNESLTFSSPEQGDMSFGGPFYPFANYWSATDDERNANAGLFLRRVVTPRVRFDLGYDYTSSRGVDRYDYASTGALPVVYAGILDAAEIGDRFPANVFRRHEVSANVDVSLNDAVGLRVAMRYQRGHFFDWHRAGFDSPEDLVVGNRVFTGLVPPTRWGAMVLGAFISIRL